MLASIASRDTDWIDAHRAVTWALTAVGRIERVVLRETEASEDLALLGQTVEAVHALYRKAGALGQLGRTDEVRTTYQEAERLAREGLGPDHPLAREARERAREIG
jgi:hypothetical protein